MDLLVVEDLHAPRRDLAACRLKPKCDWIAAPAAEWPPALPWGHPDHSGRACVPLLQTSLIVDERLELLHLIKDRPDAHPGVKPVRCSVVNLFRTVASFGTTHSSMCVYLPALGRWLTRKSFLRCDQIHPCVFTCRLYAYGLRGRVSSEYRCPPPIEASQPARSVQTLVERPRSPGKRVPPRFEKVRKAS